MQKIECFKIQILEVKDNANIFEILHGQSILRINNLKSYFQINPTIIVADPFLFVHKNKLCLFYESKRLTTPGVIQMIYTEDLKQWSEPVTVLAENFHLSYPFIFEDAGTVYMIPESGLDKSIRLYEATNDTLTDWVLKKKLLEQAHKKDIKMGYADSSIYKNNGIYYLMTTVQYTDGINTLELYYSDSLTGNYESHPQSPLMHSQQLGRNAGCLQLINDKLYRYSQDCIVRYGDNVNISEITELSPQKYSERLIKQNIFSKDLSFYRDGGHQFNVVHFCGKTLIATDAKEYHYLLLSRIVNKLLKALRIHD